MYRHVFHRHSLRKCDGSRLAGLVLVAVSVAVLVALFVALRTLTSLGPGLRSPHGIAGRPGSPCATAAHGRTTASVQLLRRMQMLVDGGRDARHQRLDVGIVCAPTGVPLIAMAPSTV